MSANVVSECEWKLRTDAVISDGEISDLISKLHAETGLSPLTLKVCIQRGLDSSEAIQQFLSPKLEDLADPFTLKDMDLAVARISVARANGEFIRIFGDYDVDGTTGVALLTWFFRDSGLRFDVRQPDRLKDGYGLNVGAVEEAARDGVQVLLTVDCGITSFDAASKARELGIVLIVVDHHQLDPQRGLPIAEAVINPQRDDCPSGLKQLCGCGLAFYLARAVRFQGRKEGWWPQGAEPNLKQHLDLVVMATAADMVPLLGNNHILTTHGLAILRNSRKPGVKALLTAAGIDNREVSPGHLGFVIGPRINASGRLGSANLAYELLTTTDASRAFALANELESLNRERMTLQDRIWDEVRIRVEKGLAECRFQHSVVVADAAWHEGVVGIVASKVTETFRRPAVVIALREGIGKGSVRSFGGKDVLSALRASASTLLRFGGHRHAAGLSLAADRVEDFARAFDEAIAGIQEDPNGRRLLVEGTCSIEELTVRSLEELEHLGPFGPGNPEPVFVIRAKVRNHQVLKGRHLKLFLGGNSCVENRGAPLAVEAMWFHAAECEDIFTSDALLKEVEWAAVPELNRFRGRVTPTLRVKDWRHILS